MEQVFFKNAVNKMSFIGSLVKGILARVVERQISEQLQDVARRITARRVIRTAQKNRFSTTITSNGDVFNTMVGIINKHKGQIIRVRMYGDDVLVFDNVYTVPVAGFDKWFKSTMYDFTDGGSENWQLRTANYDRAYVLVTRGSVVEPTAISPAFAEGATNCVLKPIQAWVEERTMNSKSENAKSMWATKLKRVDKYEKDFPDGIPEKNMQEICDDFRINITIDLPLTNEYLKWKYQKKAIAHFKYLNTKLDHAEHLTDKGKIIQVSQEELNTVPDNYEFNMYKIGKGGNYNKVITIDGTYVLHDEFTEALDAFDKRYDMCRYQINHIKNRDLSHFVRSGTHFNCSVFLKEQPGIIPGDGSEIMFNPIVEHVEHVEHIDMIKAYTQFKKCSA